MILNGMGFHAFNEYDLRSTIESQIAHTKSDVEDDIKSQQSKDESSYILEKIEKHKIGPIELLEDKLTVTSKEEMIPAKYFPQDFFVESGESYPKQVLRFHLPFKGDANLLRCIPSSRVMWTEEIEVENNEIIFELINFNNSAEAIAKSRDAVIDFLKKQSANVNNQIREYDENLEKLIRETITATKEKIDKNSDFLKELGTPIKE